MLPFRKLRFIWNTNVVRVMLGKLRGYRDTEERLLTQGHQGKLLGRSDIQAETCK